MSAALLIGSNGKDSSEKSRGSFFFDKFCHLDINLISDTMQRGVCMGNS
jgi:hypothetical protein